MKLILALCLVLNIYAFGDDYKDDIEKAGAGETASLRAVQEHIDALTNSIEEKRTILKQLKDSRSDEDRIVNEAIEANKLAKEQYDKAQDELRKVVNKDNRSFFNIFGPRPNINRADSTAANTAMVASSTAFENAEKKMNAKKRILSATDEKIGFHQALIDQKMSTYEKQLKTKVGLEQAQRQKMAAMKANISNLELKIQEAGVWKKLDDLKSEIKDGKLKLAVLENTYNQGLIGTFLKAKLEGLLRDPVLCDATKSCSDENAKKDFRPNLDRLFSSTERDRKKQEGLSRGAESESH
ncbi:MAG: hypothetical protein FJ116_12835 [Deltaproteobacteria bacterium]|nr:hypothetical protein [Deltaproteobacteria bacterium]